MTAPETAARIVALELPAFFVTSSSNQLSANITFDNPSDLTHSAQVVFRGYVRVPHGKRSKGKVEAPEEAFVPQFRDLQLQSGEGQPLPDVEEDARSAKTAKKQRKDERSHDDLLYEFFHEQRWLLLASRGRLSETVGVTAWLPRLPPSGPIFRNGWLVEYSCRVTIDPWYANHHVEKTFLVQRTLTLKEPHLASFPFRMRVNQCLNHGGVFHKSCTPINGDIWMNKCAFVPGESVLVRCNLSYQQKKVNAQLSLVRVVQYRTPDAGHEQLMNELSEVIAEEGKGEKGSKEEIEEASPVEEREAAIGLRLPEHLSVSIPMTIFNVMSISYAAVLRVKAGPKNAHADFKVPIIVTTEPVKTIDGKPPRDSRLYTRAVDKDDDSADEDDIDSDLEEEVDSQDMSKRDYSIDVESLYLLSKTSGQLADAYVQISLLVNSLIPRVIHSLRLMFTGECRSGAMWYEFLRYKALVTSDKSSSFSPGSHVIKIALPFGQSQYDTNILAPSLDDDIRYTCKVTLHSWRRNAVQMEREIFVDRFVDTWAQERFKAPYEEQLGAWKVYVRQRCFQRGKFAFASVTGAGLAGVRLELVQHRKLRRPGQESDDYYVHKRIISQYKTPPTEQPWPEEFYTEIPPYLQPSLDVCYWNVLVLSYTLIVYPKGQDGHEHKHAIPVWIGCTDDGLGPPMEPVPQELAVAKELQRSDSVGSLPEFEVWRPEEEELQVQPWWVERFNHDTYV